MSNILKDFSQATADIVARTAERVVAVHGREWVNASGVIVRPGVIVTAEETLDHDDEVEVTLPDGKRVKASFAGRDPGTDVAVLRCEGAAAKEPVAASPVVGSLVLSVGRNGPHAIASLGVISFVGEAWRSSQGGLIDANIRADIRLARQAEGGALIDAEGALIGMAVFGPRRRVLAIPLATVLRAADQILAHGSVSRGYIGVSVQPVSASAAEGVEAGRAAMVIGLDPEGPAKAAGLLLGDIVTNWNGEAVSGPRGIVDRLGPETVGSKVKIGIVRAGNPATIEVTVAKRPAA